MQRDGTPISRLTMAAWQVRPPRSVTMAAARFMTGTVMLVDGGYTSVG